MPVGTWPKGSPLRQSKSQIFKRHVFRCHVAILGHPYTKPKCWNWRGNASNCSTDLASHGAREWPSDTVSSLHRRYVWTSAMFWQTAFVCVVLLKDFLCHWEGPPLSCWMPSVHHHSFLYYRTRAWTLHLLFSLCVKGDKMAFFECTNTYKLIGTNQLFVQCAGVETCGNIQEELQMVNFHINPDFVT